MDPIDFAILRGKMKLLELDDKFIDRPVNVDFSGGEKKRNEILQMAVLNRAWRSWMKRIRASISTL